jgi:exodeoxyribonuclease VII small subunit
MSENKTFEGNIQRLNFIIKEIENPNTELDMALELYKEAAEIIVECNKKLSQAELTVKEITDSFELGDNEE